MRAIAARHDLRTVGDFLELRYGREVRAITALLIWMGSLAIPAGQLIAIASILNVVAGVPKYAGCLIGGGVVIVYFTAGGLLTSAWVNMVQLAVKLGGFAIALPLAVQGIGGWNAVRAVAWRRDLLELLAERRLGLDVSGPARSGLHRLARAAAENLRRPRRPRRAARRRHERARPAYSTRRCRRCSASSRARGFPICRSTNWRCRWC